MNSNRTTIYIRILNEGLSPEFSDGYTYLYEPNVVSREQRLKRCDKKKMRTIVRVLIMQIAKTIHCNFECTRNIPICM